MKRGPGYRTSFFSVSILCAAAAVPSVLTTGCGDASPEQDSEQSSSQLASVGHLHAALIGGDAVGGYAVAAHGPCGGTDIPNTIADTSVSEPIALVALSEALFIATMRAACSLARFSTTAW